MSASESRSAVVLQLAEEFLERYRQGQRPSLKEYIDRHPELAGEIKEVFPAMALMENIAVDDESLAGEATGPETVSGAAPPEQLGDYRILREVGRGGMGIVYEAEQVSLGRHVALKVLPRKVLLDGAQKRRFEREAKAAAKLHHTNIVPVFGVGEHEGLPYYVMQFIQGLGLDEVLDELKRMQGGSTAATGGELRVSRKDVSAADVARSLLTGAFQDGEPAALADGFGTHHPAADAAGSPESSATSKLSDSFTLASSSVVLPSGKGKKASYWQSVAHIGLQVAEALEYAHKQGIQHRDIKPSNLLLDTAGTVWVTDFGLARADNEDHLTATGDIVGTLRYMPPEAFEGRADKRGDIYSLGLTLYELLALQPAFAERDRHRLIKRVTTEEPSRLDKLQRAIPRDLVTIVHKAIDREPSHRYQTAGEFSADLRRFLDDEPIQARRITNRERFLRWCRHHPGVAALTATLALILLGVTVVSLVAAAGYDRLAGQKAAEAERANQAARAAQEAKDHESTLREQAEKATKQAENNLREAEKQKQRAEVNFAMARKAVDEYLTKVSESELSQVPGMRPLRRDLLQSALTFYQDFLKERGDDAALRGELAAAFLRVGKIRSELGEAAEARNAYELARQLYEALSRAAPKSEEWRHGLAQCCFRLGRYDEAIALWEKLVQPGRSRYQKDLADAYNSRAIRAKSASRLAEALQGHQKALAIREMLVRLHPDDPDAQRDLSATLNNIGTLLDAKGRLAEALVMYRRAVEYAEIAFTQAPQVLNNGRYLIIQRRNIAKEEQRLGHSKEAMEAYQRVVEVARKMAQDNSAVPSLHTGLFRAYGDLALYQRSQKQTEQAERTLGLAREVLERLPGDGPDALYDLARCRTLFSNYLVSGKGKPTDQEKAEQKAEVDLAMEALHKAVAAGFRDLIRLRRETDLNALHGRDDFKALQTDLAARLAADKQNTRAQAQAVPPKPAQTGKRLQSDLAASQHAIALIQLDLGKLDEAQKHLNQALALREALAKEEPNNAQYQSDLTSSRFAVGNLYWQSGRLAEGAKQWQRALDALETATRSESDRSLLADQLLALRRMIAQQYAHAGLWSEAADHYGRLIPMEGATDYEHFCAACLTVRIGDSAAYRRVCAAMVKRFGEAKEFWSLGRLAWACVLADGAGVDPSTAIKWIQAMSGEKPPGEWPCHLLGLASYRAGRFSEAIAQANQSISRSPTWRGRILNWPLLAMAHQRLGHAAEAHKWLERSTAEWRRLSPLMHALGAATVLPSNWDDIWHDWLAWEILLREASVLIAGAPSLEEAYDLAHRSLLSSRLGDNEKAETQWQAAVKIAPRDPALLLARGRAFAELGQHEKADASFAKAAALTPRELDRFPQAGWWVVGPYPEDLKQSCPPEKDPDPSRPIAADGSAEPLHWRSAPTESDGRLRLWSIFATEHIAAYALTYVYSPQERTAILWVGGDDRVRVWLNGRLVHQTEKPTLDFRFLDAVPVALKAGRNTLLCKISQKKPRTRTGGFHYLYLRIADNPLDRAYLHAELGLWDEAAAEFARSIDRQPTANAEIYTRCAHARLLVGDPDGYRRDLARMFARYDRKGSTPSGNAFWLAYAGGLLDGAIEPAQLVELAELSLKTYRRGFSFHAAGIAHYRAGQFEKAIERLQESLKHPAWPEAGGHASELGLALAHHRLDHAKEARQWLDNAEQWYDKAIQDALASPTGTTTLYNWADWPSFVVLRREAHKQILGKDLPDDPRLKKLADRMRDRLKKLDPATADYDVALLLSPNEPRLWQARAERLTELKRTKEAEADFAKAKTLIEGNKAQPKK